MESRCISKTIVGLGKKNTASIIRTVTCQKFNYNFTLFQVYHVISAKCYTLYSKKSLFNTLDIAVIKY